MMELHKDKNFQGKVYACNCRENTTLDAELEATKILGRNWNLYLLWRNLPI